MATVRTEMEPHTNELSGLEELVRQHQLQIWQYLRYLGAANAEADDLTQETFLALYRALRNETFEQRDPTATLGYLRTVAKNQLLILRRRAGKELNTVQLTVAEEVWSAAMDRGDATSGTDGIASFLHELEQCREKLEGRARQAVDWFYQDGLGLNAIAERLEMKPQGVKTLLRRTRKLLRECVERGINR